MQFDHPWDQKMAAVDRAHAELCAAQAKLLETVADLERFEQAPDDPEIVALGTRSGGPVRGKPGDHR